ncbi:MAG TPA: TfoX/Sxy family protein [Pseudolysinimonas sp.]
MQIPKPTDADKALFTALAADIPDAVLKPMFGNLGAFVNGNMFAGLFGSAIGVKIPDAAAAERLRAVDGTGPFGPEERPMVGYIALPAGWSPDQLAEWIAIAHDQVAALPPKKPKPAKSRK